MQNSYFNNSAVQNFLEAALFNFLLCTIHVMLATFYNYTNT